MEQNIQSVQGKWGRLGKILVSEEEYRSTAGIFYVVVVQAVLIFGSEKWVLTPRLEKSLKGFHHWSVWRMEGMVPKRQHDGTWLYPPIGVALETVGLEDIGVYSARRQNMVTQYIATCPIMDLCLSAERNLGLRQSMQ